MNGYLAVIPVCHHPITNSCVLSLCFISHCYRVSAPQLAFRNIIQACNIPDSSPVAFQLQGLSTVLTTAMSQVMFPRGVYYLVEPIEGLTVG